MSQKHSLSLWNERKSTPSAFTVSTEMLLFGFRAEPTTQSPASAEIRAWLFMVFWGFFDSFILFLTSLRGINRPGCPRLWFPSLHWHIALICYNMSYLLFFSLYELFLVMVLFFSIMIVYTTMWWLCICFSLKSAWSRNCDFGKRVGKIFC